MAQSLDSHNSLYDFVVRDGNGVKGMVDLGLLRVPGPYIQPPKERINKQNASQLEHPPIDFSRLEGPDHDEVVKQIATAAETFASSKL
ncbi:hypothetical protein COLO4_03529 [Corchorus olitorius]|uniref:Uncharacterized protein n=1 Tax=Corchorus olitorius TaxID=93759 RepID=A0A1R3KY46_9ROSI|nr:hypothetical protein COLO4_03529 [Corchorus olitorius]